jgi:RHH-type proline utilization regulon transcriptional repressor/proline dehydrogenase/delta 1-pyrroline-5-carboxylate dehydrogenase
VSVAAGVERLAKLVEEIEIDPRSPLPAAVQRAVALARRLQERGVALETPEERRQQAELERMVQSPTDKATLLQLTDQAFRAKTPRRAAEQLTHILDVQGVPRFFSMLDRAMLRGFQSFGAYLPGMSMPMVQGRMRAETANVILPAETELLVRYLAERRASGLRMNVNFLGEALLGEQDARARLESYLAALQLPEIECISVKVSTLYSQITPIGRRAAVKILADRLELLYRAAAKARFLRHEGTEVPKFVYLDMEEYRDLGVTVDAFIAALDRPGLEHASAGIALQAYIPDSFAAERRIHAWARARVARGGAPVTLRIVKGANMEAERVEASLQGWEQAPFLRKIETDANYKRMLHEALEPDNAACVRVGVATHNLFEVAYALVLAHEREILDKVQFEMLEGMANHQRRALSELAEGMLLYAPATRREEFINAIGYLIRRLDENTGPENFLRHAFKLEVGSETWRRLEKLFVDSFAVLDALSSRPRRTQDRREPLAEAPPPLPTIASFDNEPDTDFALEPNLVWAENIVARWRERADARAAEIPLVVAGEEIFEGRQILRSWDPSRPGVTVARYRHATEGDIERALGCAVADPSGWRALGVEERGRILAAVAHEIRASRGELMGAALADGGKILTESDPEVSEAVDFVAYYAASARELAALDTIEARPKGVVVVVPPWNFPIAIPCGGVSAALAAGNTVILKPASHTVLVAWELCRCFWRAGVPREALQFVPCAGASGGQLLVTSPRVDAVILTGGTSTALRMLAARPEMSLCAETGGKNATIITAMSDRELAIKHVLHSAFSHSGQKCSATSLLVLEAEVYDDPLFKRTLCDAVESMVVGSAWDLDTRVGPLIAPPGGDLVRGLKELEDGESWAVMTRNDPANPCLYAPAVKWDVRPASYTHMTEFFGPVLAVLRADDLDHAIEIVNQTGYGLTSGLESLDEREQAVWKARVRAGNLYINRVTTGAIVHRQPFGGVGKSSFGPGIKAGGPNYVAQLMSFRDREGVRPIEAGLGAADVGVLRRALRARRDAGTSDEALPARDCERLLAALASYEKHFGREIGREHDPFGLVGQDNTRRYRAVGSVRVRVHPLDTPFEIFARVCAAKIVGARVTVSTPPGESSAAVALLDALTEPWAAAVELVEESDAELAHVIAHEQTERVRYAAPERVPLEVLRSVGETGVYIARAPVLAEGRLELLWYVWEQSVSHDYHRYGNLGARGDEKRRPVR